MKGDWVEDNKGDVVRSRFVVKQIAYDYRDDVSQSTPALLVFRMMLAFASSNCPLLKTGTSFYIAIWDISVAFMHATIDELIFVHPPKDLVKPGFCWKLKRAMNGTRRASRQWADKVTEVLVANDFVSSKVFAMVLFSKMWGTFVAVWGDDFAAVGGDEGTRKLDALLEAIFDKRLEAVVGPSKDVQGKILNRIIAYNAER